MRKLTKCSSLPLEQEIVQAEECTSLSAGSARRNATPETLHKQNNRCVADTDHCCQDLVAKRQLFFSTSVQRTFEKTTSNIEIMQSLAFISVRACAWCLVCRWQNVGVRVGESCQCSCDRRSSVRDLRTAVAVGVQPWICSSAVLKFDLPICMSAATTSRAASGGSELRG